MKMFEAQICKRRELYHCPEGSPLHAHVHLVIMTVRWLYKQTSRPKGQLLEAEPVVTAHAVGCETWPSVS